MSSEEASSAASSKRLRDEAESAEGAAPQEDEAAAKRAKTVVPEAAPESQDGQENPSVGPALPYTPTSQYTTATPSANVASNMPPGVFAGTVKWFDITKGFGFIVRGDGQDVFVHQSGVTCRPGAKGLAEGEEVWFRMDPDSSGKLRAEAVTGVNGAPAQGQVDPMTAAMYGYMGGGGQQAQAMPSQMLEHTQHQLQPGKYRGQCKWFNPSKGFGFIIPADGSGDVFVHNSACSVAPGSHKSLAQDEKVEFEVTEEQGKRKAHNVTGPGGAYCVGQARPVDPSQQAAVASPYGYAAYGGYAAPQMPQMYGTPAPVQYGGYPQYGGSSSTPSAVSAQPVDPNAGAYAAYYAQQAAAMPQQAAYGQQYGGYQQQQQRQ